MEKIIKEMWLVAAQEMKMSEQESNVVGICEKCYVNGFNDALNGSAEAILVYDMLCKWEKEHNIDAEISALSSMCASVPENSKEHIVSILSLLKSISCALHVSRQFKADGYKLSYATE